MAERLAANCGLQALKELALALGVQSAPIARGKRHTRLDIARAILERADELRDIAEEHQKLRSAMLKAEETLSEVKDELDGLREMQLIQLVDNDDEDFSDVEFYRNEAASIALSLGERDDRAWGLHADEVIHLEVHSMWGEPEELVVLPGDEIRSQKHRIGSIFNLDDKSAFELELFAMRGDKKHTRMDDMTTFGQYFAPGSQGVVLIGVSMRGGGGEQKRPRRDDEEKSYLDEPAELDEGEDQWEDTVKTEADESKLAMSIEQAKSTLSILTTSDFCMTGFLNTMEGHAELFKEVGSDFIGVLLRRLSLPKMKQLTSATWLTSKHGRYAVGKLAGEVYHKEFFIFSTYIKMSNTLKQVITQMVGLAIRRAGMARVREHMVSILSEKTSARAVKEAKQEEEAKKKSSFMSRLLG
jgi:hypothetical protein